MKKLVLSFAAICAAVSLNAQTWDLETNLVTPASGSTIPASATVNVSVNFTNNGPDAIVAGSDLWFSYVVNDTDVYGLDGTPDGASGVTLPTGFNFASGQTISSAQIGGIILDLSGLADGDEVCIVFWGEGADALTASGDAEELNFADNFDCFTVSVASASIEENDLNVAVYPNPANDVLNIDASEEIANVSILGLDGKVVATSLTSTVNVAGLNSGMYIYEVTTTSGKVSRDSFMKK